MTTVEFYAPVEIRLDDLIDVIHEVIDHDNIAEFVKNLDLRYEDFEVTEGIIGKLLESLTKEFEARYEQDTVDKWKKSVLDIHNMMEAFD